MSGLYAYISGPMTGYPDLNRRAFADAASKIEQTRPYLAYPETSGGL